MKPSEQNFHVRVSKQIRVMLPVPSRAADTDKENFPDIYQ